MKRYNSLTTIQKELSPVTAVIGNFDGLHIGHLELINNALSLGKPVVAVTFDPHPATLIYPDSRKHLLSTPTQKMKLLSDAGIDGTVFIPFTKEFASQPPLEFADSLREQLRMKSLVIGEGFRFGKNRSGTTKFLTQELGKYGIKVKGVPTVEIGGCAVSSTRIRKSLESGDLQLAEQLLGRPYSVTGVVCHGLKLGRKLGFPTANIKADNLLPAMGVYAAWVFMDKKRYPAAVSIGQRTTLGIERQVEIEVHIIGFKGDIYGSFLRVELKKLMRVQKTFKTLKLLKEEIDKDIKNISTFLAL
jgi:riboflavin kinase / FMN adenylyltransferase